jgi:hypothetical protein
MAPPEAASAACGLAAAAAAAAAASSRARSSGLFRGSSPMGAGAVAKDARQVRRSRLGSPRRRQQGYV